MIEIKQVKQKSKHRTVFEINICVNKEKMITYRCTHMSIYTHISLTFHHCLHPARCTGHSPITSQPHTRPSLLHSALVLGFWKLHFLGFLPAGFLLGSAIRRHLQGIKRQEEEETLPAPGSPHEAVAGCGSSSSSRAGTSGGQQHLSGGSALVNVGLLGWSRPLPTASPTAQQQVWNTQDPNSQSSPKSFHIFENKKINSIRG